MFGKKNNKENEENIETIPTEIISENEEGVITLPDLSQEQEEIEIDSLDKILMYNVPFTTSHKLGNITYYSFVDGDNLFIPTVVTNDSVNIVYMVVSAEAVVELIKSAPINPNTNIQEENIIIDDPWECK